MGVERTVAPAAQQDEAAAEPRPETGSGLDAAWELPEDGGEAGEGDGAAEGQPGGEKEFDITDEEKPSGLAHLVRRDLDDDAKYALHPDVALMREEKLAAELGIEVSLVRQLLRR